jgi:colanic acid/amylovoran biosynthesis glycosyltransferase
VTAVVQDHQTEPLVQRRLAIATRTEVTYSETFIRGQIKALKPTLVISGRPVADMTTPGGRFGVGQYAASALISAGQLCRSAWRPSFSRESLKGALACLQSRIVETRLQRHKIEVMLTNFGPCAAWLCDASRRARVPLIAHFHGYDAHGTVELEYYRDKYQALGKQAAAIIAVSNVMRKALIGLGMPEEKIEVIRCGVNLDVFTFKQGRESAPRFLSVGRFTEKKAPYLSVLAFSEVVKRIPQAKLVMIGDGLFDETVRNIAVATCPVGSVEVIGRADSAQVVAEMHKSTALLQHSVTPCFGRAAGDREGTPVVVLEAMACGLPVVGSRHAGIGEVVEHGKSGFLVEERDVAGFASAMLELAENPRLVEMMGLHGRLLAEANHSSRLYYRKLSEVIDAVAQHRAASSKAQVF